MKMRLFLTLLLVASGIVSCGTKDPIVKRWKLENIDASGLIADVPAEMRDTIQSMLELETASQRGKMYFDIRDGGKMRIYSPDLQGHWEKMQGKWIYNPEARLLTVELKGKKDEYIVHELDENTLRIELVDRRAESSLAGLVNGQKQGTKVIRTFR